MSTQLGCFCSTHREVGMIVAYIEEKKIRYDVLGGRRGVKNIYKLERASEEEMEGRFILDGPHLPSE